MFNQSIKNSPSFEGRTRIYAMTDSHQETRKARALLSEVLNRSGKDNNVLLLNNGDLFKGVYSRELEKDSYIRTKETKPDMEIAISIGNNDFGFNIESLQYLIDTIKEFASHGIRVVCANIFNSEGFRPDWLKPYTVIERDGDKNFITGFCINNINTAKFGIIAKNQMEVIDEIAEAAKQSDADNFIILNHDYMDSSQSLYNEFARRGIKPDLIIGGHDHDTVPANEEMHIYYPLAFFNNMYEMDLNNTGKEKTLDNIREIKTEGLKIIPAMEEDLAQYEAETGLLDVIAPVVLNLPKEYSYACPLGSFLADEMKNITESDIGFFSTGFLMQPLKYQEGSVITNYNFKKVISADNTLATVNLTAQQLKEVYNNALKNYNKGASNPKFLQSSSNLKIDIKHNPETNEYEVQTIYLDGEPLSEERTYKCCIESYIANGGQGFKTLQESVKTPFEPKGKQITIAQVLKQALINAPVLYEPGSEYPTCVIETVK